MEYFLLGFVLILLLLSFSVDSMKEKAKNSKADFEQKLNSLPDFDSTQQVLAFASPLEVETYAYNSGIALDDQRKENVPYYYWR
ncbi:MAG: hypothetical protein ABL903_04515 [Methylococcales bacterium]